jgi:hypothetical protein
MWVSGGSDTQNMEGTQRFILVQASELYIQQYSYLRVRNAQSGITTVKIERVGKGSLSAIVVLVGVLPQRVRGCLVLLVFLTPITSNVWTYE